MKEFTDAIPLTQPPSLFPVSALLFDIETTGFSAKSCSIYLIGCAYQKGSQLLIHQFFSETPEDEFSALTAFLSLCKNFTSTISFNGTGFDLPFLRQRCRMLSLTEFSGNLEDMEHRDLFRRIFPFKNILKLPNLKQKSLEEFLSIHREDTYSGGDLITIYKEYLKSPDHHLLSLLLLHNKEDLLGMENLLSLQSYPDFFQGKFYVQDTELHSYQDYEGMPATELLFTLALDTPVPKDFSYGWEDFYLTCRSSLAQLRAPVRTGELKYFYPDYQNYYYLPMEDIAIHKSVASYVDRKFRTKAKASNCYTKKKGQFLPQYGHHFSPCFKTDYHGKCSYLELTEDFRKSAETQREYLMHLFASLISS